MDIRFEIGKVFIGKNVDAVKQRLAYAAMEYDPHVWVGINVLGATAAIAAISALVYLLIGDLFYVISAAFLTAVGYYLVATTALSLLSDQRARYVEQTLPDALLLMASNLRSGMATDQAVLLSARPEFGFLADKLKEAGRRVATGENLGSAMIGIGKDIDSRILSKTIDLIVEGLESGGEIATLLEETATDIRDNDILQREIRSVILVYALFIFVAAVITAPVLYAISTHLAQTLSRLSEAISVAFLTRGTPTLRIAPSEIAPDFLIVFAYVNLIITAVFGSLMVSLITRGNEKYGLRYIPVFIAISIGIFLVARFLVSGFFASIRI